MASMLCDEAGPLRLPLASNQLNASIAHYKHIVIGISLSLDLRLGAVKFGSRLCAEMVDAFSI